MRKDPEDYGVLGITEPVNPEELDFDVSRVNANVSINGVITLEKEIVDEEGDRDDWIEFKRQAKETPTKEVTVAMQIDDSTEAYVALTSPEDALYEWLLPEGYADGWSVVTYESSVRFHSSPILYIEAARINALENEERTQIGTLLEWLNGNPIAEPVTVTRAIAIILRDEYDVEFGELDPYPR